MDYFKNYYTTEKKLKAQEVYEMTEKSYLSMMNRAAPGSIAATVGAEHYQQRLRDIKEYILECEDRGL